MEYLQQPQSLDAERAVLSVLMLGYERDRELLETVSEDSFHDPKNLELYKVIDELHRERVSVDSITIRDRIKSNGLETILSHDYLNNIHDDRANSWSIGSYIKILKDKETRRNMLDAGHKLIEGANNETLDTTEQTGAVIANLTNQVGQGGVDASADRGIQDLRDQIKEYKAKDSEFLGHESGIRELDKKLDGIRDGHFGVITGYTSSGKTALALNIVAEFIKRGQKVVFFSLEMSPSQLISRLASILSTIPIWKISKGSTNAAEGEALKKAIDLIQVSGLKIYENPSLSSIEMTILKESADKDTSLFIVDYLGLVQSGMKSDYAGLKHISQKFQSIMKSFNVHLIALSQIDNAQIKDDNPFIIATKGSGDIAASADYVLRLKNKEADADIISELKDNNIPLPIQLYIQKNRHGATGVINLYFQTEATIFQDDNSYKPELYAGRLEQMKGKTRNFEDEFDI